MKTSRILDELKPYDYGELTENWFMVPRVFLRVFTPSQSLVLAVLVREYRLGLRTGCGHMKHPRFVRISTRTVEDRLRLSRRTVERTFKGLRDLGIVDTRILDMPARRWVSLKVEVLGSLLRAVGSSAMGPPVGSKRPNNSNSTPIHTPPKGGVCTKKVGISIRKRIPSPRDVRTGQTYVRMAEQLRNAISSVRTVSKRSKPSTWANAFRLLHTRDGTSMEELRRVLKWYCRTVRKGDLIRDNPEYIPIAYSGPEFRKKYEKVLRAYERTKAKRDGPKRVRFKSIAKSTRTISAKDIGW